MRLVLCCLLSLILTACATKEKSHYYLNDASLRIFEGGDKVVYSVLDESLFTYSVTLTPKDEFAPDNNSKIELLYENQAISGNLAIPFLPRYFQQNAAGDLILKAIGYAGEVLWLMNENNKEANETLYPSDITTLSTAHNFTRKLQRCNVDNECFNAGEFRLLNLQFIDKETVETSYADFEVYKLAISVEIEVSDAEQAGDPKFYSFAGTQWIHPLIGTVKFFYDTKSPSISSPLIGPLSNTNISIAESYKTKN